MNVSTIRSLTPGRDDSPDAIVEVIGEVRQRSFATGREALKPLTLYFVWNSREDCHCARLFGEDRTLLEIITAAFNPVTPADDILPHISGFRPPYMGWDGHKFLWYGPKTSRGSEVAQLVERLKQDREPQLVGVGRA